MGSDIGVGAVLAVRCATLTVAGAAEVTNAMIMLSTQGCGGSPAGLDLRGGSLLLHGGGGIGVLALRGAGVHAVDGDVVVESGGQIRLGTGTLTVGGNLTVAHDLGGGLVETAIAGPHSFGVVQVGGAATIDGTLDIRHHIARAKPGAGFPVIRAGSLTGVFSPIEHQLLDHGLGFVPVYSPGGVTLVAQPVPGLHS